MNEQMSIWLAGILCQRRTEGKLSPFLNSIIEKLETGYTNFTSEGYEEIIWHLWGDATKNEKSPPGFGKWTKKEILDLILESSPEEVCSACSGLGFRIVDKANPYNEIQLYTKLSLRQLAQALQDEEFKL